MKIISFNIRCCDDKNGHSIDERAPRLKAAIDGRDPDIVGFQEVRAAWLRHIERDYGEKYEIFNKYRDGVEGCCTIWKKDKYRRIDSGFFWYSDTPWVSSMGEDGVGCRRMCSWVILEELSSGKKVTFYNTHFGFGDEYQVRSAELLKMTAELVGGENTMIVGDFNCTPKSPAYKSVTEKFLDANMLLERDMRDTYHAYGEADGGHIDYLFVERNGAVPVAYSLLDDSFEGKYPSDHYGLFYELKI